MKYDAIVVLGAVMVWDGNLERWTFPDIVDSYPGKLVLGEKRAQATAYMANLAHVILVTGGSDTYPETGEKCSRSVELAKIIVNKGVPSEKVIAIGQSQSNNTQGDVENAVDYLKANNWIKRVVILSPLFQFARAKMMFEMNSFFKDNDIILYGLIIETVLMQSDPRFIPWFEKVYTSPEALVCQEMEVQGIKALREKSYAPKS
jgi:hypothetical protein